MKLMYFSRYVLIACELGLLALFGIWYAGQNLTALLIGTVPLIALLPGSWLIQRTPLALGGFLSLAYLAHGLTELIANPEQRWFAAMELFLALALLINCSWLLRLKMLPTRDQTN